MEMKTPSEIVVDPVNITFDDLKAQTGQYISTALFCKSSQLSAVVGLALEGHNRNDTFAYSSVGCSYGAELDSTTALLTASGVDKAHITGIDIDDRLLHAAKEGQYLELEEMPLINCFRNRRLRNLGFETLPHQSSTLHIDANRLRGQHEVDFQQANLAETSLSAHQQNLVTCNNVLPHVGEKDPQNARDMAARLCSLVAPGGILSIAVEPMWFGHEYGKDKDIQNYDELHRKMVATMRTRYAMEVALRDKKGRVAALRKLR
jgi:chemotaxis methyl-accepting protein methylase